MKYECLKSNDNGAEMRLSLLLSLAPYSFLSFLIVLIFLTNDDIAYRYAELYSKVRVRTLASLDALPELRAAGELKNKLLFSVVVLAFRAAKQSIAATKLQVRKALQVSATLNHHVTYIRW